MTDGPFRNAELSPGWKEYGEVLANKAMSAAERSDKACHSMLGDVDLKEISKLLGELKEYADQPQQEFFPEVKTNTIFKEHEISPFATNLKKHLEANMRDKMPLYTALDEALKSTARDLVSTTKNRLDEQCISSRDRGDTTAEDCSQNIESNREAFSSIDQDLLCDALISGTRRAFKRVRLTGNDEGPDE